MNWVWCVWADHGSSCLGEGKAEPPWRNLFPDIPQMIHILNVPEKVSLMGNQKTHKEIKCHEQDSAEAKQRRFGNRVMWDIGLIRHGI